MMVPFQTYPACGHDNPPPLDVPDAPGVFAVPGALPDGSRMLLAYDDAEVIVARALVEPGGNMDRAILDLHRAARA